MSETIATTQYTVGDVGADVPATIYDPATNAVKDISSATLVEYNVRKPDGTTVVTWTASFVTDGADGRINYTTQSGDIDQAGVYLLEVHVVGSGFNWRTSTKRQIRVVGSIGG